MLNFRQVEIFRAIMIAKTVSGAAQLLNCSQPGLSRMLRYMEDRIGFSLFNRAGGRLVPTQEAAILFDEVQFLYKGMEDLDHVVRRLAAGHDRVFRLGASPSLGKTLIPKLLRKLQDRFKTLTLHFDILSVEQMADYLALARGEYALSVYAVDHPNIVSEQIGEGRMVCAVHSTHPLAGRERISVAEIAADQNISFRRDTAHGQAIAALFGQAGVEQKIATYVRFAETALAFVGETLGTSLIDEFTAADNLHPDIRILELVERAPLPVYLNRGKLAPRSAVGGAFETLARECFAGDTASS
jgi:DNA-binding transcriptional LysR family regulator